MRFEIGKTTVWIEIELSVKNLDKLEEVEAQANCDLIGHEGVQSYVRSCSEVGRPEWMAEGDNWWWRPNSGQASAQGGGHRSQH